MSVLAHPARSQLLLVEPVAGVLDGLPDALSGSLRTSFCRLSLVADRVMVPQFFAVSEESEPRAQWLAQRCEKRRARVFYHEAGTSVFARSDLLEAMREQERDQLYICGFWLDDVVTSTALEALVLGFDTHIIVDLSLAYDRRQRTAALGRCNQYGVVPITLVNLIYEWTANCHDAAVRRDLMVHWEAQKEMERRGASA